MNYSSRSLTHQFSKQEIRVLIVDDARLSQHIIQQQLLEAQYRQTKCVNSAKSARDEIETFAPQIIILDWMMPEIDGLSLTKMIRAQDKIKNTYTYVFMITGKEGQNAMMQAFQEGVSDFIGKADVTSQLIPRMLRAHQTLRDWHERQHLEGMLRHHLRQQKQLITIDPVSHLPTQLGFKNQFLKSIETASARTQGMSCMLIQISNYEMLKNNIQPAALQKIIRIFVEKLGKYIRPSDYLARIGVHEFIVIFIHEKNFEIPTLDRIERGLNKVSLKTKAGFHTIDVRTANTTMAVDMFTESWNDEDLQYFLRSVALGPKTLVDRLHQHWPTSHKNKKNTFENILFSNSD